MHASSQAPVHVPLGQYTRPLVIEAGLSAHHIEGIDDGSYTWSVARPRSAAVSADPEVARQIANEDAGRRGYVLFVHWTSQDEIDKRGDDRAYDLGVSEDLGRRLIHAREREGHPQ